MKIEEKVRKLSDICLNLDPYQDEISSEYLDTLKEFDIDPKSENPFTLTNRLLKLLDEAQMELKQQSQQ